MTLRPLLALVVSLLAPSAALAQNVGVLHSVPDPRYATDVIDKLRQTGILGTVTGFNVNTGTPTANDLNQWDAVIVFNDAQFSNTNLLGDRLADYVDRGGGVVEMVFANTSSLPLGGRFQSDNYKALIGNFQTQGIRRTMVPVIPNDPLLAGVRRFNAGQSSYIADGATAARGARMVAEYDNGVDLAAYWEPSNAGVVVGLNFYPPSSDARSDFWDASTDGDILMANALQVAAGMVGGNPQQQFRELDLTFMWFCPGYLTFGVANATPLGRVALVIGEEGATSTVPVGPCAGTTLPLGGPQLLGMFQADRFGQVQTQFLGIPDICGLPVAVLDMPTCSASDALLIPTLP